MMNGKMKYLHTFLTLALDKAGFITHLLYPKKSRNTRLEKPQVWSKSSPLLELNYGSLHIQPIVPSPI
jgi:hypothetical protein